MADDEPMRCWGNQETMNLNNLLYKNILAAAYYKECLLALEDYPDLMLEAQQNLRSLEPFLTGTSASTAFCILFRLHSLKPTRLQLEQLLDADNSTPVYAVDISL